MSAASRHPQQLTVVWVTNALCHPENMTMVDVGGHQVAARVTAGVAPTVVFVAQIGTEGRTWQPVVDRLTSGPSIITYDRPGVGRSEPRPDTTAPVPYSRFGEELATMLDALGVIEPVVLVGHSVGSLFIRMFAGAHPSRVAGMVHVDGSIPALRLWSGQPAPHDGDGPDASLVDPDTGEREIASIVQPRVPGVVLVRTPGRWAVELPDPAIDQMWQDAQAALAAQIGATLLVARDAGHQIPREAPDLVAQAVDAVVVAARAGHQTVALEGQAAKIS